MKNYFIDHLFEFWEYIGLQGDFFTKENGFKYSYPSDMSWPSKVFAIDSKSLDFEQLKLTIIPKSLWIFVNWLSNIVIYTLIHFFLLAF